MDLRRRSQLYVPANNPRMVSKAAGLEADSILLDLEDAVPPDEKAVARESLAAAIRGADWGRKELAVRINAPSTPEGKQDLAAVAREAQVATLVVPKAEADLSDVARTTAKGLIPLIETPKGVLHIEEVVRSEGVVGVSYGAGDLAAFVGGDIAAYGANPYVRTLIAVSAAAYGLDAIDKVYFGLTDLQGFRDDAVEAKRLGYVGKQVVHPSQIPIANEVFTPTPDEVARASEIIRAYEAATREGRGAIRVHDQLVDAVHYRWAKRAIERAGP